MNQVIVEFSMDIEEIERLNRQTYDTIAAEYDGENHHTCRNFDYFNRHFLQEYCKKYVKSMHVDILDIGVGTGNSVGTLIDEVGIITGALDVLDISENMLQVCRHKYAKSIRNSINTSIFSYRSSIKYQRVISTLCDPFLCEQTFESVSRLLTSKGHFVITFPSEDWVRNVGRKDIHINTFKTLTGVNVDAFSFSPPIAEIKSIADMYGFKVIDMVIYDLTDLPSDRISQINAKILSHTNNCSFLTCIVLEKRNT